MIKDTQSSVDIRKITIDRVGVKRVRHPLSILQRDGTPQASVAYCDLAVLLPAEQRGTHMSRFVELLNKIDTPLTAKNFTALLHTMLKHLEASQGGIQFEFPFFMQKIAPVSKRESLLDYKIILSAEQTKVTKVTCTVVVPVKSLCPCSKEISEYGAHNQRSHLTVTVAWNDSFSIEELIELIEAQGSSPIYSLLKRSDEKYLTEYAYNNPKFAEDLVRDTAAALDADTRFPCYKVEAENFESIHNHSAYAWIEKSNN